uniref:4-hydroxybenzoate polyprenyltransferase, mitochondrial n=1 Tax=Spongospora subterranea TaxID=70186 RepID=A0A0H5QGI7_9EUKA|eukprot:CRZ00712.1 hypothetical protein [Spongospora subterranea]
MLRLYGRPSCQGFARAAVRAVFDGPPIPCGFRSTGTGKYPLPMKREFPPQTRSLNSVPQPAHVLPELCSKLSSVIAVSRIKSPLPSLLLMWPCFFSAGMSCSPGALPSAILLTKFAVGAVIMRGAGCTINDILDQRYDGDVERTKNRPLVTGSLSVKEAVGFLALQLSAALGILLSFDPYCIALGASSLILVFVYPLMKRLTNWPQFVLGLAFNWGAFIGWAAVQGSCSWSAVLPLYASGVCWTIVYDTIYAYQDVIDDRRVGIRSTALLFGDKHSKAILSVFASSSISFLLLSGYMADMHTTFYVTAAAAAAHLAAQIAYVDLDDRKSCQKVFLSNAHLGGLIASGIFLDRILS